MATGSASDSERAVVLSPPLEEWLDDRAASLGLDRDALLVELLETHRTAAELDDESLLSEIEDRAEMTDDRLDDLEARLTNNVEDLRGRILQLRDAIDERAPAEHTHEELGELSDDVESLSEAVDAFETDLEAIDETLDEATDDLASIGDQLETVEGRLHRLARIVVARERDRRNTRGVTAELDDIRRTANQLGILEADCGSCGDPVTLGLLSEAVCPHCGSRFDGLEASTSVFRWFQRPSLSVVETSRGEN